MIGFRSLNPFSVFGQSNEKENWSSDISVVVHGLGVYKHSFVNKSCILDKQKKRKKTKKTKKKQMA